MQFLSPKNEISNEEPAEFEWLDWLGSAESLRSQLEADSRNLG